MSQPGPSSSDEPTVASPFLMDQVELSCSVKVGDEMVMVRRMYAAEVYDDPEARKAVEEHLRFELVRAILDQWKPKIHVRR